MFKLPYVYMLKCSDDTFYVGVTNDLNRRLVEHNEGLNEDSYTSIRRPVELVYWQDFSNYEQAIEWETRLKKWSRKKKQALVDENWNNLKEATICQNETNHENKIVSSSGDEK